MVVDLPRGEGRRGEEDGLLEELYVGRYLHSACCAGAVEVRVEEPVREDRHARHKDQGAEENEFRRPEPHTDVGLATWDRLGEAKHNG